MEQKSRHERNGIVTAFALALRRNQFGRTTKPSLRGDTIKHTIAQVAQTFRTHGLTDPSLDAVGRRHFVIDRLLQGFIKADAPVSCQPALPLAVFRALLRMAHSELDKAVSTLVCGALFFGMRSCEYLKVPGGAETRQTKKIKIGNIVFRSGREVIPQHSHLCYLQQAETVSITFENQKNGEKMETVTQHRTDIDMCPVKFWASTVHRIRGYPGSTDRTTVDTVCINGNCFAISAAAVRVYLRRATKTVGEEKLGFSADGVGTHSVRASFAMMLVLNNVEDSAIMKKGRWKSAAFLDYIRQQLSSYGLKISKMIASSACDDFFAIPHVGNIKLDTH